MQQIQATTSFRVPEANRTEFRGIVAELIALVSENEPDALQYLWFFSEDGSRWTVREIFRNSKAVLHHLHNCAEPLSRMLGLAEASVEMCGQASDELRTELAGALPPFLAYHDGVDRLLES